MKSKSYRLLITSLLITVLFMGCKETPKLDDQKDYESIKMTLEKVYDEDQEIRRILVDSIGFNSPETPIYARKMKTIDSINKIRVITILEKYGLIHKDSIGKKASDAIFLVIQHSDTKIMNQYFPLFKKASLNGGADKKKVALMEDRFLMWNGKKQKYGTQASTRVRDSKEKVIWPIENPEQVNVLRGELGFSLTVEEYAKKIKAIYDPNEELPNK